MKTKTTWWFTALMLGVLAACSPSGDETAPAEVPEEAAPTHEHAMVEGEVANSYEVTAVVEGDEYETHLVVTFEAQGPFHLNHEYPWRLRFEDHAPIVGGPVFTAEQAEVTDTTIRFDVLTSECEIGAVINAELSFALCSPGQCEQATEPVSWEICNLDAHEQGAG